MRKERINAGIPAPSENPNGIDFEQRSRDFLAKHDLTSGILRINDVIKQSHDFLKQYQVPDSFIEDDINLALILGCSQKLVESTDSDYRSRVENFQKRIIASVIPEGLIDEENLWGKDSDRAGMNNEDTDRYIADKNDPDATREFLEKYTGELNKCKAVWKAKGYDLIIEPYIVNDETGQFQNKTKSRGFVHVPDRKKIIDPEYKPTLKIVLEKGGSAESSYMIRHELYHVEDYFDLYRRGYQSGIFELIDELHTEYTVVNYTEGQVNDPEEMKGAYWSAKRFWDKLSFIEDLDFNLLGDRRQLLDTVITEYGVDGLIDFSLVYAHGGGKIRAFETFYNEPDRGVLAVILAGQKLKLRKAQVSGNIDSDITQIVQDIKTLAEYLTPNEGTSVTNNYIHIYDLVPNSHDKFWAARIINPETYSSQADNRILKELILSFTKGLAIAEVASQGVSPLKERDYRLLIDSLAGVPFHKREVNFTVEGFIKKRKQYSRETDQESLNKYAYFKLFQDLSMDLTSVEITSHLQNQEVKGAILQKLFSQLDYIALQVVNTGNPDYLQEFIKGVFSFNQPIEIRNQACEHMRVKYPSLKPILEKAISNFDSRKYSSHG